MAVIYSFRELCRETAFGFVFWSLFDALAPMIWFYPLNAMEVSGYEAFLLMLFSPLLLESKRVSKLVNSKNGQACIWILSLLSLGSFHVNDTLPRLAILSIGNSFAMLAFCCNIWNRSTCSRLLLMWGLILGRIALLVSRIWFTTFIPTWYDTTSNSVIMAVGSIAVLDKLYSGDWNHDAENKSPQATEVSSSSSGHWALAAVGFGSLLFLTQWLFGEVSVVLRWIGQPHPNTGPQPLPYGLFVLLCIILGIAASFYLYKIHKLVWWLVGFCAFLCLYTQTRWIGFSGGLVLAVFTFSLWPVMLENLTNFPPGRTMALAIFTWTVQILYEIWTVAYNFVPGGVFTREHTGHLIVIVMVGVLSGMSSIPRRAESKETKTKIATILSLMMIFGLCGVIARYPKLEAQQRTLTAQKANNNIGFSAGVWAFHFGYDNKGWPSVKPSSEFIRNTDVDIFGLLETDASKPFLGNNDLVTWLSETLGMYADFGPSTRTHCWGIALLSKYPIVASRHELLPSPHGELAPAIMATVNITNTLVDVLVTHMGNDWDTLDRQLQAKRLADLLRGTSNPVVFLGYVTSKPGSRDYRQLISNGNVKDIDDTDKKRFCLYIMYRGLIRLGYARVSHGGLSDTEVQMARFTIPTNMNSYTDNDVISVNPLDAEEGVRFNPIFGSYRAGHNWEENHSFHMSTPKYFLPKK